MAAPPLRVLWALQYNYVPNILRLREPHRAAHLAYVRNFVDDGRLLLGGALGDPTGGVQTDPVDEGLLVFDSKCTREEVAAFALGDPYVVNELVTQWRVRQWNVAVGSAK
jgi:uncharacterized protein YciI